MHRTLEMAHDRVVSPSPSRVPPPPLRTERLATHIWVGVLALFAVLATSVGICLWALVGAERAVSEIRTLAVAERHAVANGASAREPYMHEDVDPVRLSQVVRNLVNNAASVSAPEDTIRIEIRGDAESAVIRVRDRGTGIAPADLPHVFEPFHSKRPGGTGLGLAVCHGIVGAHGGTIELETTPPGATTTIRLPRTYPHAESAA